MTSESTTTPAPGTPADSGDDAIAAPLPLELAAPGADAAVSPLAAQQLTLLDASDVPLQFRLDRTTRERGLAHVAELRRLLASRRAA